MNWAKEALSAFPGEGLKPGKRRGRSNWRGKVFCEDLLLLLLLFLVAESGVDYTYIDMGFCSVPIVVKKSCQMYLCCQFGHMYVGLKEILQFEVLYVHITDVPVGSECQNTRFFSFILESSKVSCFCFIDNSC